MALKFFGINSPAPSPYQTLVPGLSVVAGALVSWVAIAPPTHAVTLGQYTFDQSNRDSSNEAPDFTFQPLQFVGGGGYGTEPTYVDDNNTPTAGKALRFAGWKQLQNNQPSTYYEFTIYFPSNPISLTAISLDTRRNSSSGPSGWLLRSNQDTYANDIFSFSFSNQNWQSLSIALPPEKFGNLEPDESVTFRLYAYGASSGSETWDIDDVTVEGEPVPEPITILGGLTALGFGTAIRRKYKRNPNDKINSLTPQ